MKSVYFQLIVLSLIALLLIGGCGQKRTYDTRGTNQPEPIKGCSQPSDCGNGYDCINSNCVKITPPSLPE